MTHFMPTQRTTIHRMPTRATYDRVVVEAILDEGLYCHLGFTVDGQPYVIPTIHARVDDRLYVHGSSASRMLRSLKTGVPMCVTVTILDGLVFARSAFHHSVNYRSVVIFGEPQLVETKEELYKVLELFTEKICSGRWNDVRKPTDSEWKQTMVLAFDITEASAKVRTGPPKDDEEDYTLDVWAGVVPLKIQHLEPIADPDLKSGVKLPSYLR